MQRMMLKSKLHRATVTDADLEYEGSITIDRNLMKAADLLLHERVEVYNITNGERFATYVIEGPEGSGVICVNGAAAHLVKKGHKVIICSYVYIEENELEGFEPTVILLNEKNEPKG
jgi:aspartate 1-decarboxylase